MLAPSTKISTALSFHTGPSRSLTASRTSAISGSSQSNLMYKASSSHARKTAVSAFGESAVALSARPTPVREAAHDVSSKRPSITGGADTRRPSKARQSATRGSISSDVMPVASPICCCVPNSRSSCAADPVPFRAQPQNSAATPATPSAGTPATATRAPSPAICRALAAPIPDPPPVIRATFPSSLILCLLEWQGKLSLFATHGQHRRSPKKTLSWPTAEPASVGLDAELLNEAWSVLAECSTQALLVLRRGTWRRTHRASRTRSWQSMIQHTVPTTWSCLGGKASSGGVPATSTPSTVKPIPLRWRGTRRPSFPPGSTAHYSNPGTAMLSHCIMVALQGTPTADVRTLLHQRVHAPLGLRENEDYSIGYGRTWDVDGLPLVANWGGGGFTPRATARVGQLLAQDGGTIWLVFAGSDIFCARRAKLTLSALPTTA